MQLRIENAPQAERIERIDTKPKSSSSSSNERKTATFFEKNSAPQACKNLRLQYKEQISARDPKKKLKKGA
jgi:hypothetical protein